MGPEVLIFMMSINCHVDFDSGLWSGFDAAMSDEWNVTVTTSCYQTRDFPLTLQGYKSLAGELLAQRDLNSTVVAGSSNFAAYIDGILDENKHEQVVFLAPHSDKVFIKPLASGVAYPTENLAFVENNFEYSTGPASHEILHLVLEEQGHDKSCYVDKVHENQYRYELKQMGKNEHAVIKKFDC